MAPRYSCASLSRSSMLSSVHWRNIPGSDRESTVIRVLMYPGEIEFTRINGMSGRLPHSAARERVSCTTAAFEELYAAVSTPYARQVLLPSGRTPLFKQGKPTLLLPCALMLAMNTMLPCAPCLWISRATTCAHRNAPVTLMSSIRRSWLAGKSTDGPSPEMPAQQSRPRSL
jgi:hypothetical protein